MNFRLRPYAVTDVPSDLDGSSGGNRAPTDGLQVPLGNDREAIGHFLEQYAGSPGTHRIYSRECERIALWAFHVLRKPLSSLNSSDVERYIEFLASPAQTWCGPKMSRETEDWRPFVGPLATSARLTALSAVNTMLSHWVQAGYLKGNPLGLFRQLKQKIIAGAAGVNVSSGPRKRAAREAREAVTATADSQKVERYLDGDMWVAVMKSVEAMAPKKAEDGAAEYERARFVMALLYLMAPRVGELETHRMNSFREDRGRWWWHVVGKGDKAAKVPVPDDMLQALIRYRRHLDLPPVPSSRDDSPLLRSTRHPGQSISARRLNQILKSVFIAAVEHLPSHAEHKADKLILASAHWGRHTSITAKVDAGMNHLFVQSAARHSDFKTTQLYIHGGDEDRHDDAQKQRLHWSQAPKTAEE